jgi:hypothetical protein
MTIIQIRQLEDAIDELKRTRAICEGDKNSPEWQWCENDAAKRTVDDIIDALTNPPPATPKVEWETEPSGHYVNNGRDSFRLPVRFGPLAHDGDCMS